MRVATNKKALLWLFKSVELFAGVDGSPGVLRFCHWEANLPAVVAQVVDTGQIPEEGDSRENCHGDAKG